MTVLSDAWQARVSPRLALQLTNPDTPNAQTVNLTRLLNADADVKAEFQTRTGQAFDETNAQFILVGVRGITLKLHEYRGLPFDILRSERERWFKELDDVAGVVNGGQTWISPTTDSPLVQSSPVSTSGNPLRPLGDDSNFNGLVPFRPKSPGSLDRGDF